MAYSKDINGSGDNLKWVYSDNAAGKNSSIVLTTAGTFVDRNIEIDTVAKEGSATIKVTGTASAPTVTKTTANTAGAINVGSNEATKTVPTSGYFVGLDATSAAKDSTAFTFAPSVEEGWITGSDITLDADSKIGSATSTYYIPVAEGSYTLSTTGTSKVTPVISRVNKTADDAWIDAGMGEATDSPTDGQVYVKVKSAESTTTLTPVATVSAGYMLDNEVADSVQSATVGANASADTYIPVTTMSNPYILKGDEYPGDEVTQELVPDNSEDSYLYVEPGYNTTRRIYSIPSLTQSEEEITKASVNATSYTNGTYKISKAGYISSGVKVNGATFANTATEGTDYLNISDVAPVLISDDGLYINAGYTDNLYISLAQLVPNEANITAADGADYMLSGKTAYDSEGKLITGTIVTKNNASITFAEDPLGITVPAGYYAEDTSYQIAESSVTSGEATAKDTLTFTDKGDIYEVAGDVSIGKVTVNNEGYISNNVGTNNGNQSHVTWSGVAKSEISGALVADASKASGYSYYKVSASTGYNASELTYGSTQLPVYQGDYT